MYTEVPYVASRTKQALSEMKLLDLVLMAVLLLILPGGCSSEQKVKGGNAGDPVKLHIVAYPHQDTLYIADNRVASLRVMVFSNNDLLLFNTLHDLAGTIGPQDVLQDASTGARKFAFVANEPASVSGGLAAVTRLSDLNGILLPADDFNESSPIPMVAIYEGTVISLKDGVPSIKVGRYSYTDPNPWQALLVRRASRINLTLAAESDITSGFRGVVIRDIPATVPLVPRQGAPGRRAGATRSYPQDTFTVTYNSLVNRWLAVNPHIILPSKEFRGGSAEEAVKISADMSDYSPTWIISVGASDGEYGFPPDVIYNFSASITSPSESLTFSDWGER